MHPDLSSLIQQLEAVKADATAFVPGLSHAQFNWRPAPERWSIAECLDHLNVSMTVTLVAFDRAIVEGRQRGLVGEGPFRYGMMSRMMVWSMEPPVRIKQKRPKAFDAPRGEHAAQRMLPEFLRVRDEIAARVRGADGLDLARVRVQSLVSRWIRMPLGAYFAFILAHERRHLWQARQVAATPGFPPAG